MKNWYVIHFDHGLNRWHMLHPHAFSLTDAESFKEERKESQENLDIVHAMWLDCLEDWPTPGFFTKTNETVLTEWSNRLVPAVDELGGR